MRLCGHNAPHTKFSKYFSTFPSGLSANQAGPYYGKHYCYTSMLCDVALSMWSQCSKRHQRWALCQHNKLYDVKNELDARDAREAEIWRKNFEKRKNF